MLLASMSGACATGSFGSPNLSRPERGGSSRPSTGPRPPGARLVSSRGRALGADPRAGGFVRRGRLQSASAPTIGRCTECRLPLRLRELHLDVQVTERPPAVVHTFALMLAPAGMVSVTAVPTRFRPRLFAFVTVNATLPLVALPLSSACSHLGLLGSVVAVVVVCAASRATCGSRSARLGIVAAHLSTSSTGNGVASDPRKAVAHDRARRP